MIASRRVLALLIAGLLWVGSSAAESARVLLVRPQRSDPTILAAFNRLRGELMASGFTVVIHEEPAGTTPKALAAAARDQGAFASVSIVRSNGSTTADVWISDRVTGKTSVRTISTTKRDAPDLLAVRATDLLKVSLREFGDAPPPADIASADPTQTIEPDLLRWSAPPPSSWRLGAGVAGIFGLSDVAPGIGPTVGLSVAPWDRLELGVSFVGPLLTPKWTAPDGRVTVRQELGSLDVAFEAVRGDRIGVEVAAAVGAYHLAVSGEADLPLLSRSDHVWAVALGPAAALSVRLSPNAALRFGVGAWFRFPEPQVLMGGTQERLGQPALVGTAGLRVGL